MYFNATLCHNVSLPLSWSLLSGNETADSCSTKRVHEENAKASELDVEAVQRIQLAERYETALIMFSSLKAMLSVLKSKSLPVLHRRPL